MYEKYHTALRLMDACLATKDLAKPEGGWKGTYLSEDRNRWVTNDGPIHPCHAAWDACFDFIFANFAKPETAMDGGLINWHSKHAEVGLVRPLIDGTDKTRGEEIEAVLRGIPPKLCEEVFPVGIARFLMRDCAIPVNHRMLRTFKQFHDWYGTMILSC